MDTENTEFQDVHVIVAGSVDEALDRNLDDMASGLARLKGLAQGLNSELSDHNQILDRWVLATSSIVDSHTKISTSKQTVNRALY